MSSRYLPLLVLGAVIFSFPVESKVTLKIGTIVPEKSGWMKGVEEFNNFIEKETNGALKILWFTSGVLGDEPEIIERMKKGEIDGAGLSGLGLGIIAPEIRIFELPFLFSSYDEVDYIRDRFRAFVNKTFREKGYEFIGWADQGFIYFFSKQPIITLKEISGKRAWIWKGDPLAEAVIELFPEVIPVKVEVVKLRRALLQNQLDFFYFPPIGVIGFGLYENVKYIVYPPIVYGLGALIIRKDRFDSLPSDMQDVIKAASRKFFPEFIKEVRSESEEAINALLEHGFQKIQLSDETIVEIKKRARKVYESLGGKMYPLQLLAQVLNTITMYRVEKSR